MSVSCFQGKHSDSYIAKKRWVRKGEGVSMVKGVEGVLPKSLPGVKKLLHNINNHRYCVPKTQIIWLSNLLINKPIVKKNIKKKKKTYMNAPFINLT
jgi:hypothetical protein